MPSRPISSKKTEIPVHLSLVKPRLNQVEICQSSNTRLPSINFDNAVIIKKEDMKLTIFWNKKKIYS